MWGQESVDVVALVTGLPASSSSFLPLVSWYMVSLPVEGFAWFGKGRTTLPSVRLVWVVWEAFLSHGLALQSCLRFLLGLLHQA